jgi:hypothetical protein
MNRDQFVSELFTFLVSGGALALVSTIVRGIRTRREGVRAYEREAIGELVRYRRDCDQRLAATERDRDYYRRMMNRYYEQLVRHNIDPDPSNPTAPGDRVTNGGNT